MTRYQWLGLCAALAGGEFFCACVPELAWLWPLWAMLAVLVFLFGWGFAVCGWRVVFMVVLGAAFYCRASLVEQERFRESPWLRGRTRAALRFEGGTGCLTARIRRDFARRVAIGLEHDREVVALNRAILLGMRSNLPRRAKQVFVDSGTMHVFAISGLHVMAVAKVLIVLLSFAFVSRRWAGALALPLLWGYVHLIGWSPSAIRAALMASLSFLAPLVWRKPDLLMSWVWAFLLVHLWNPLLIADTGSALSFTVMLSIVLAGAELFPVRRGWGSTLGFTVAAWAAGVPIAAHVFGRITPGGLVANLVLISAVGITVTAGAVGLVVSFVSTTVAAHLNNVSALFTSAMVGIAEVVSRVPGSNFEVARWTIPQCAAWYAVLLGVLLLRHWWRGREMWKKE